MDRETARRSGDGSAGIRAHGGGGGRPRATREGGRSAGSGPRRHLKGSLERLRTDHLDLWQLHSVRSVADVDRAFAAGGAMEYLLEAQRAGLTRLVGVTGHATPAAHLRALEHWDRGLRFDVMQQPLNPIDYHQQSFQREVLPRLTERGIGVIAMKTSADGAVVGMDRPDLVRANARLAREFAPLDERGIAARRD